MCKSLKLFTKTLRTLCFFSGLQERDSHAVDIEEEEEEAESLMNVPDDVKEGHVAVVAVKGEITKRFILELGELSNPEFLRLLEQAEEEFGFQNKGPLAVPCQPEEVQKILERRRKKSIGFEWKARRYLLLLLSFDRYTKV